MPFRLTGTPTTFCEMVAIALDNMINKDLVSWMDDICIADDDFAAKLAKIWKFFNRCREKGLSLAPVKCKLFQSKAVFTGMAVSAEGITPNANKVSAVINKVSAVINKVSAVINKVSAVINWPEPTMSHELLGFLGLTGFFRQHIRNYTTIAQPLVLPRL